MQKRRLQEARRLNPVFVGKLRNHDRIAETLDIEEKLFRTIVCQQDHSTLSLCESLAKLSRPFVIVIDATPWGVRYFVVDLIEQLAVYFPDTPRLVITTSGDRDIAEKLEKHLPDVPIWAMGRADQILFGQLSNNQWEGRIAIIPDKKLNDRLASIYRHLKRLENEIRAPAHKEIHASLLRVWRTILNMVVPIDFHEMCAESRRKGGIYPIRPISDELHLARKMPMPSGVSQTSRDEACNEIQALIDFMTSGVSGKTQAIHRWAQETLSANQKGLIASGSVRDADVIRRYLLEKYHQAIVDRKIQVVSAKGVDDLYLIDRQVDRVFLASGVWKSDYWIAGLGKDFTWANYPIQKDYAERWSHEIQYVKKCSSEEAKVAWWTYETSQIMDAPEALQCEQWGDCAGQYSAKEEFNFAFEANEDWLRDLFNDLEWHEKPAENAVTPIPRNPVTIYTKEGPHYFDEAQNVETLDSTGKTAKVLACEINPGDTIVVQTRGTEDSHLLNTIMEAVYGDVGELQFKRDFASKWRPMVHSALKHSGGDISKLEKKLSDKGVTRQTLLNWLEGRHLIGKSKDTIMPAIAKIAGDDYSEALTISIRNAIGDLQGMRSVAGRILHQARLAALQNKDVIIINDEELPIDILMEEVHCEEVINVILPEEDEIEEKEALDWIESVSALADSSDGKLVITPAAKKSMEESFYKDRKRAVNSIALLLREFHPVFFGDSPIQGAVDTLTQYGIKYRGGMAETTQGMHKYVYKSKLYKGRRVDLSKHIRIGNSYNKERCFSVHFEVDKDEGALVIHHAGTHLKTSKG